MNKQDYQNIAICAGIIFVWSMILFFCIYQPYQNSIKTMDKRIQENTLAINDVENFFAKHGEKTAYQNKLNLNLQLLQEKIPSELAETEFLTKLNEIALLSDVKIVVLNPSEYKDLKNEINKVNQDNAYNSKSWQITLHGEYFNILKFLRQINAMPRLVNIKIGEIYQENDYVVCKLTLQIYSANYNK